MVLFIIIRTGFAASIPRKIKMFRAPRPGLVWITRDSLEEFHAIPMLRLPHSSVIVSAEDRKIPGRLF